MTRFHAWQFFVRCLAPAPGDAAAGAQLRQEIRGGGVAWEEVIAVASRHYMIGTLAVALGERGLIDAVPADVAEYFAEIRALCAQRNRRIRQQVVELARTLNAIGLEPVLLKGAAHLMDDLYPDDAARLMDDIDVLLPERSARAGFDQLLGDGYESERPASAKCHHLDPLKRAGRPALVELHHCVPHDAGAPLLSGPEVLARSKRLVIDGALVRVPSPTDSAIIVVLHSYVHHRAHLQGTVYFRDLDDLVRLDRRTADRPDWAEVHRRFTAAGYGALLRRCATMAERVFGQPAALVALTGRASPWEWRRYLLHVKQPWTFRWTHFALPKLAQIAETLREAGERSEQGSSVRRKFFSPAFYWRNVRSIPACLKKSPWH